MSNSLIFRYIDNSHYQISNKGNIRNSKTGRILKPYKKKEGLYRVNLYYNNKRNPKYVHALLLEYFKESELLIDYKIRKSLILKL